MKTYIKPELQVINVSSASMICGSETMSISDNDYNGAVYSPRRTMGFDDDDI